MNSTNTTSISSASTNYRQKGKQPSSSAKIYKGFIHDATSKLSVGSIPAKFETIIYRNQSSKAFGTSNPRFSANLNDVPGPEKYNYEQNFNVALNKSEESLSKLSKSGQGRFSSSQERNVFGQKYINCGPGPGTYKEANFFDKSNTSISTLRSTVIAHSQLAQAAKQSYADEPKVQIVYPGPGEYEAKISKTINTYQSSFISKTRRDEYLKKQEAPPPGQYNIKRSILKPQITHKGPTSSFYPEGDNKKEETTQKKLMNFIEDPKEKAARAKSPGPCDYDFKEPTFQPDYVEYQEMSSFKILSRDRFGDPVDKTTIKTDSLGPGQYTIKSQLETIAEEKTLVSGPAFMSESLRKPFGDFEKKLGPNPSLPYILPQKKNFHLNLQSKWV